MTLKYIQMEIVNLSDHHDEKWLQDKIDENPKLIGLGELTVIHRERRQSTGGRIDFVLSDPETDTRYEVEIQLGATDESHIIRAIEYWDLERRRYPSKDHTAVIIAENITNRFFNVISLMNKSIPIIAIQLSAVKVDDSLGLIFTKILDTSSEYEDEDIAGEPVDRKYWEKRADPKSISLMDETISLCKSFSDNLRITYNKSHVTLGSQRKNFAWFHPRQKEGYCHFNIQVGIDNVEEVREDLEKSGIPFTRKKADEFGISLQALMLKEHNDCIKKIFQFAYEANR